jgi:hypothetical protein
LQQERAYYSKFQDKDPETGLKEVFCMDFEEIVEEQKKALKQENKEFET